MGMILADGFTQDAHRHVDLGGSVFQLAHALPVLRAVPSCAADAGMLGSEPFSSKAMPRSQIASQPSP
jgi:hypothetical protein